MRNVNTASGNGRPCRSLERTRTSTAPSLRRCTSHESGGVANIIRKAFARGDTGSRHPSYSDRNSLPILDQISGRGRAMAPPARGCHAQSISFRLSVPIPCQTASRRNVLSNCIVWFAEVHSRTLKNGRRIRPSSTSSRSSRRATEPVVHAHRRCPRRSDSGCRPVGRASRT
jgi:hypothetical protein